MEVLLYMWTAKTQIYLHIRAVWSRRSLFAHRNMISGGGGGGGGRISTILTMEITFHYENMRIQIYWKFYHQKMKTFR